MIYILILRCALFEYTPSFYYLCLIKFISKSLLLTEHGAREHHDYSTITSGLVEIKVREINFVN